MGTSFIGDVIKDIQDSGCSLFFFTSSALSIYNGEKNRANSWENAIKEQKFQDELLLQKEKYEDMKEAEEKAFKIWLRNKQRDYSRIESSKRLENELTKPELQMFFTDWPLQIAIETVHEKRLKNDAKKGAALNIVVGKYNIGSPKDAISKSYITLVDEIKTILRGVGIEEMNILKFKDKVNVVGGAALANIYAMMSDFPTLVLLPKYIISDNIISISIAIWNQDSLFPMQREIFHIECNYARINNDTSYLQNKLDELKHVYATISVVVNDTHLLVESFAKPKFPQFALKHSIPDRYPYLINFAKNEYQSILMASETVSEESQNESVIDELFTNSEKKLVNNIIKDSIHQIEK